ncbi:MAG: trypsin-like peptidase domain-containing protein [Firmicutes bacterium]|nr:trypsin-like peptidase domain-containing protein [Bacillota bacterium]
MDKDNSYRDDNYEEELFNDDIDNELEQLKAARKKVLTRITAFITLLAFLAVFTFNALPINLKLIDLVYQSLELEKDLDSSLLDSVVEVSVLAGGEGLSLTVRQKSGTGFNISTDGVIVTNHHVIENAKNIIITFPNGEVYKAESWSSKPEYDLAVIKLQANNLPSVPIDTLKPVKQGEKVTVVGNPLGFNNVVTEGDVGQYLKVKGRADKIFTINAPIYPGNSGSPVFNNNGEVVGVVFASLRSKDSSETIAGAAIPIKRLMQEE